VLVTLHLHEPAGGDRPPSVELPPLPLVNDPGATFASPRWSPDGNLLVAERRSLDGTSAIVLVDPYSGSCRPVVSSRDARNVTPIWTPDGRFIVFASARGTEPFQLFRVAVSLASTDLPRAEPLLVVSGGASSPAISGDGRTIVFVGLTAAGYDLFAAGMPSGGQDAPWPPGRRTGSGGSAAELGGGVALDGAGMNASGDPDARTTGAPYSPWPTLAPRAWRPLMEGDGTDLRLGAVVEGADVLGYHAYQASITLPVTRVADLGPAGARRRIDWDVAYNYSRWWPTLFVGFSSTTTPSFDQVLARGRPPEDIEERSRELSAGIQLVARRVRSQQSWVAMFDLVERTTRTAEFSNVTIRNAVRAGWSFNSARLYGYSVSPEHGMSARATWELVGREFGADGTARAATIDVRSYSGGGWPHAVLAFRGAAGFSSGDRLVRRAFSLGGSQVPAGYNFGRHSLGLLRGFPSDAFVGERIGLVNVDYRFPLLRIERGSLTRPLFIKGLHGAVFLDAGDAWSTRLALRRIKTSAGGELSADLTLGYSYPFTFVAGAAWTRDPTGTRPGGVAVFVRAGRAF
jgi:hypothetical protein